MHMHVLTCVVAQSFFGPSSEQTRRECLCALRTLLRLLDIPYLAHPSRTLVNRGAFDEADKIRELIKTLPSTSIDLEAATWRDIWPQLQKGHNAMWFWDVGCGGSRLYIDHMLASARLADHFERGEVIDDSLYVDIVR